MDWLAVALPVTTSTADEFWPAAEPDEADTGAIGTRMVSSWFVPPKTIVAWGTTLVMAIWETSCACGWLSESVPPEPSIPADRDAPPLLWSTPRACPVPPDAFAAASLSTADIVAAWAAGNDPDG